MDHIHVGLQAAIRALRDVVAPAVDPGEAQANDQLRLAIDYLEFMSQRIDHLHDRELFDLRHHLSMARNVIDIVRPLRLPEGAALAGAIDRGEQSLANPESSLQALKNATAALAGAISNVVRKMPEADPSVCRDVERCVLHATEHRIAFERAWYLPLGLEPDPGDVRPLAEFFAVAWRRSYDTGS